MQNCAMYSDAVLINIPVTNSKHIIRSTSPYTMEFCGCVISRIGHNTPGAAIIMQDCAAIGIEVIISYSKNVTS